MAGAAWERKQPTTNRAKALFDHLHAVIEQPDLNPDLRQIENDEYRR